MKTTKLFASILSAGLALCLFAGCAKDTTSDKDSPDVEEIEVVRTAESLSGDAKQSENNGDWKVDLPQAQSQVTTTTKSAETQNKETTTTTKKSTIALPLQPRQPQRLLLRRLQRPQLSLRQPLPVLRLLPRLPQKQPQRLPREAPRQERYGQAFPKYINT